jgi:Mn2+/Fe2+ NRAMP family transporter
VFYVVNVGVAALAASVVLIPGAPLLSIALNANVLATVLLPVSLVLMLMIANDRELMGNWVNGRRANRLAVGVIAFVALCGLAYGVDAFLQSVHLVGA